MAPKIETKPKRKPQVDAVAVARRLYRQYFPVERMGPDADKDDVNVALESATNTWERSTPDLRASAYDTQLLLYLVLLELRAIRTSLGHARGQLRELPDELAALLEQLASEQHAPDDGNEPSAEDAPDEDQAEVVALTPDASDGHGDDEDLVLEDEDTDEGPIASLED